MQDGLHAERYKNLSPLFTKVLKATAYHLKLKLLSLERCVNDTSCYLVDTKYKWKHCHNLLYEVPNYLP